MKTYIVNSFTNQLFKGNPAGVCFPQKLLANQQMLSIAKELGLSETAFIHNLPEDNHFAIRYFSPKMEIPLCGHATLASAKVIYENIEDSELHFITAQNLELTVSKGDSELIMEFPVYKTEPTSCPEAVLGALGIGDATHCAYNQELNILLIEISDSQTLAALKPNYDALIRSHTSINGVVVTAASTHDKYDFHSRYFWPWSGTNEDPVTGGTHTFLAPYWSERLAKRKLKSYQSSARTGYMDVELVDDETLLIKSEAVIVLEGDLRIE